MAFSKTERSWILYDWANSAYALVVMTAVLPIYFKDVAAQQLAGPDSTAYWGYANTAATLLVALLAPILGAFADAPGMRKRLFFFFFAGGVLTTAGLAAVGSGAWRSCLLLYALSLLGFAGANVLYDAFLVDVTTRERMNLISTCGFAWGYVGSTMPFIASLLLLSRPAWFGLAGTASAARVSFILVAVWWAVFTIPLLQRVTQQHGLHTVRQTFPAVLLKLRGTLREIAADRNLRFFLLAYFCYIDGVDTIIKMAAVYGRDIGIDPATLLLVLLVVQIVAFPCALLYGRLARLISARRALLFGIAVYTGISLFAGFVQHAWQFWLLALLVATSQGGIQALSRSFFGTMIPADRAAEFFGIYNIFGRFAAIIGPLVVGLTSQLTHSSRLGIASLILLFLLGAAFLIRTNPTIMTGSTLDS